VNVSITALLGGCDLSGSTCEALLSVLSSPSSSIKEIDLSYNHLEDSGVKLLFAGVENLNGNLEILSVSSD
ncbi:hypothetical protein CHARACLAT_028630, partial [Characodon lateralis]|nr:hypothetical protein [Characodon lateralis]